MTLNDVKPGDAVILRPLFSSVRRIAIVERTTKIQIIVDGNRYFRATGHFVQGFNRSWIVPATVENLREFEQEQAEDALRRRINAARRGLANLRITTENLEAVEALLRAGSAPGPRETPP